MSYPLTERNPPALLPHEIPLRLTLLLLAALSVSVFADIVAYLDNGSGNRGVYRYDRSGAIIEEIAEELNFDSPPSAENGYVGNRIIDLDIDANGDILILNYQSNGSSYTHQVYRFDGQTNTLVGLLHQSTSAYREIKAAPDGRIVLRRGFTTPDFTLLSSTGGVLQTTGGAGLGGSIEEFTIRPNGNFLIYVVVSRSSAPWAKIVEYNPVGQTITRTIGESRLGTNGGSASLIERPDGTIHCFSGGVSSNYTQYPRGILEFNASGTYVGVFNDMSQAIGYRRYTLDDAGNLYAIGENGLNLFNSSGDFVETVIDESDPSFPEGFNRVWQFALIPIAPPTANAGADQNVFDSNLDAVADVSLDGSASTSGRPITDYAWTWNDGGPQSASGESPTATFPLGSTTVTLTITDDGGNSDSDTMLVSVSYPTFDVTFDLLGQGVRSGGGALSQVITAFGDAVAPTVNASSGFIFTGWDIPFDTVTSDLNVSATYGTDFNNSGPADDAFVLTDRDPPSGDTPATVEVGSLTLNPGLAFELGPNETLVLNSGPLTIGSGASFTANGIVQGSIINAGLLRIPVLNLPDLSNTGVIVVTVESPTTITTPITMGGGYVSFTGDNVIIDTPSQMNDGIISTDASLEVTGDYTQTASGVLRSFISGPTPGITYSQLESGGDVSMNGELQIVFRPDDLGYLPEPGDTFDLVVATGSGTISLDPGLQVSALVESTQTGAFDEDSIPYTPFDSGLGPVIDPDDLQLIGQAMFTIALAESSTVLRATYTGPDLTDFYDNAPTNISATGTSVSEADGPGTLIATLSATSPIAGGHTFALVPGEGSSDNALFSISDNQLLSATGIDFETSPNRNIRLQATNAENRTYEKEFIILILNSLQDDDDGDNLTEEQELALGTEALKADSDGDGYNDGDEVNDWGTDPLDAGDRFSFAGEAITIDGTTVTIEWSTVVGKTYKVEGNTSLSGDWMEVPGTVNGTGNDVSLQIDISGTDYRFFRVKTVN